MKDTAVCLYNLKVGSDGVNVVIFEKLLERVWS
jgi:hypothetical protein